MFIKKLLRILRNIILWFLGISVIWVAIDRFLPIYLTPLMVIRSVESVFKGEIPKNKKKWVSIDKISSNMPLAVMSSEDNLFLQHYGISFKDIGKAIKHNQKKGKRIHGGSTISQQTAKNVFLWPDRTYLRKGLEMYFTLLMETLWSKERIMEVYLNVIEMGDGIYGIEAASQHYFGVHAVDLTKSQAATIAACLPNPRRFDAAHPSPYILKRKSKILRVMGVFKYVDLKNKKTGFKIYKKKHIHK